MLNCFDKRYIKRMEIIKGTVKKVLKNEMKDYKSQSKEYINLEKLLRVRIEIDMACSRPRQRKYYCICYKLWNARYVM